MAEYDAVVVGAGPNGLTAAARLARSGARVVVFEGGATIGGGARTAAFPDADARYDVCSAVHPFAAASPAFVTLGLERYGLRWCQPPVPLAHPLDDGRAGVLLQDVAETAAGLGADGARYHGLVDPLLARWPAIVTSFLGPLLPLPAHPLAMARFGWDGARPATWLARPFQEATTRALLAGIAAHACMPLDRPFTGGLALALGLSAHAVGWPLAAGGSQAIVDALAAVVIAHGGEIVTDHRVDALTDLPPAANAVLDVTPRQLVALAGGRLDGRAGRPYRRWRYGMGASKADYVLSGPVPWTAPACAQAGTVHLGGTFEEIAAAERETTGGRVAARPFVLVAQPAVADPSRSPAGTHVLWTYCHVPNGSPAEASDRIEAQLDRFAPGWRDLIVAKVTRTAAAYEAYNPNDVGGDFAGGALDGLQLIARPRLALDPYRTPLPGVWLCSASTPPGAGAHGMGGWHAAGRILRGAPGASG